MRNAFGRRFHGNWLVNVRRFDKDLATLFLVRRLFDVDGGA